MRTLKGSRAVLKRGCESCWMKYSRWLFDHECNFFESDGYCRDNVKWNWTEENDNVIATTTPRHIAALFRYSREPEGFHSKVNETGGIVDSLLFLWKKAAKGMSHHKSSQIDGRARERVLSMETRADVSFGCFDEEER